MLRYRLNPVTGLISPGTKATLAHMKEEIYNKIEDAYSDIEQLTYIDALKRDLETIKVRRANKNIITLVYDYDGNPINEAARARAEKAAARP